MSTCKICFQTATELIHRIRSKDLSASEVMEAHLSQVERVNPKVNAIVTLVAEQALDESRRADQALSKGREVGILHGLPIAHKDLFWTKGIRTTQGSRAFESFVPDQDALIVERLKQAGAITIGKTNTPEFGAGSQTYNEVFGETLNPFDLTKTCGGSSGGAAVALTCGMVPLADGSDMGGSLRNPASFCNVVGLRPSPGRVPVWPASLGWSPMSVQGPMARTVQDVALMLSVIAGPTLGGLPVDPEVTQIIEGLRPVFEALGCQVEETAPDFNHADVAFKAWRAWEIELTLSSLTTNQRAQVKETLNQEVEVARKLTGIDLSRAEAKRTELYHRVRTFMENFEFLICPVSQVPPFDINQRFVTEINGIKMDSYIDWMRSCWTISVLGLPAISVPAGFTRDGLPVGLQVVGRHQDEFGVLQMAHALEEATGLWRKRPSVVAS